MKVTLTIDEVKYILNYALEVGRVELEKKGIKLQEERYTSTGIISVTTIPDNEKGLSVSFETMSKNLVNAMENENNVKPIKDTFDCIDLVASPETCSRMLQRMIYGKVIFA